MEKKSFWKIRIDGGGLHKTEDQRFLIGEMIWRISEGKGRGVSLVLELCNCARSWFFCRFLLLPCVTFFYFLRPVRSLSLSFPLSLFLLLLFQLIFSVSQCIQALGPYEMVGWQLTQLWHCRSALLHCAKSRERVALLGIVGVSGRHRELLCLQIYRSESFELHFSFQPPRFNNRLFFQERESERER